MTQTTANRLAILRDDGIVGHQRLAAAIIEQAVRDALHGDARALAWLATTQCAAWLQWVCSEDQDVVKVQARLVVRTWEQLLGPAAPGWYRTRTATGV